MKVPTSAVRRAEAYYRQAEEYCRKRAGGGFVMDGHYILWGPNGERLEEGDYVDGRRDGKWKAWLPSQLQEHNWQRGKYIGADVLGTPDDFVIDFCACNPHWYGIPTGLGSVSFRVVRAEVDSCLFETRLEIEMWALPLRRYRVPRSLGRLFLHRNPHESLDFSRLATYEVPDTTRATPTTRVPPRRLYR